MSEKLQKSLLKEIEQNKELSIDWTMLREFYGFDSDSLNQWTQLNGLTYRVHEIPDGRSKKSVVMFTRI